MDTSKLRATREGLRSTRTTEIGGTTLQNDNAGFVVEAAISSLAESKPEVSPIAGNVSVASEAATLATGKQKGAEVALAAGKSRANALRAAAQKSRSREIMLAAGRSTTVKRSSVAANDFAPCFASSFPAVTAAASDTPEGPVAFPREAIPALRLHFQSSRAEYVERRMNAHNAGVTELYCKLCLRLIVASRDEFVFPIAAKAHKCGSDRDVRSQIERRREYGNTIRMND